MKKKKIIILSIAIIGLLLIVIGVTYAFLNINFEGTKINSLYVPSISLTYSESGNALTIDTRVNNDTEGKGLPYFEFSVSGESEVDYPLDYYIYLTEEESSLTKDKIKFYLTKVENNSETQVLEPTLGSNLKSYGTNESDLFLYKASFDFTEANNTFSDTYRLRGWISHDAKIEVTPDINSSDGTQDITVESLSYKFKVNVSTTSMDSYCYGFDKNTGAITNYYCHPGNSYGYETISDVEIPSNIDGVRVVTIGYQAFQNKNITSVIIPETVRKIEQFAFAYNSTLTHIEIPKSVTSIASQVVSGCSLPDDEAFIYKRNADGSEDKTNLIGYGGANKNPVIPEGVTRISYRAFYNCGLLSVEITDTVTTIAGEAFLQNSLTHLDIPDSVTSLSGTAFNNNSLVDEDAFIYAIKSGGGEDRTKVIGYGGANRTNVVVPDGVLEIGSQAFSYCYIYKITLPEGLKVIGTLAFEMNNLTELEIPGTVTYIGNGAINGNYLPEEKAYIFARNADGSIDDTTLVSYGGGNSKTVTIPSTVKTIKDGAVVRLSYADTIIIPSSVEVIENNAFHKGSWYNDSLTTIVNQTGKSFNWGNILYNTPGFEFVTGTIVSSYGNVEVVSA